MYDPSGRKDSQSSYRGASAVLSFPRSLERGTLLKYLRQFGEVASLELGPRRDRPTEERFAAVAIFRTEESLVELLNSMHFVQGYEVFSSGRSAEGANIRFVS